MLAHWQLIEIDFSTLYHREAEDDLTSRTWRWFSTKVAGLLANPQSFLRAALLPDDDAPPEGIEQ